MTKGEILGEYYQVIPKFSFYDGGKKAMTNTWPDLKGSVIKAVMKSCKLNHIHSVPLEARLFNILLQLKFPMCGISN